MRNRSTAGAPRRLVRSPLAEAGATLAEIIIAMLVIGTVATGILTAFVFSRRLTLRSGSELAAMGFVEEISEQLRGATQADLANGLTLGRGVYVDANMPVSGRPNALVAGVPTAPLAALNLPPDFQARFQTNQGRTPDHTWANHADGRVYVVEDAPRDDNPANGQIDPAELQAVDLDGDGLAGIDFNNDSITDLRRVRVKVRFTTPNPT